MSQGAKFLKVLQTLEPQRLVNTNLRRGSRVYQTTVDDLRPPGKGVCATAVKNQQGGWQVGLINPYPYTLDVELVFQESTDSKQFRWDYYDDSLSHDTLHGGFVKVLRGIASLRLSPHSLNFPCCADNASPLTVTDRAKCLKTKAYVLYCYLSVCRIAKLISPVILG